MICSDRRCLFCSPWQQAEAGFDPRPADENGKAYSPNREDYP